MKDGLVAHLAPIVHLRRRGSSEEEGAGQPGKGARLVRSGDVGADWDRASQAGAPVLAGKGISGRFLCCVWLCTGTGTVSKTLGKRACGPERASGTFN